MEDMDDDDEPSAEEDVIETRPSGEADPDWLLEKALPPDLRAKYNFASYRKAISVLAHGMPEDFNEVLDALRAFTITTDMIRKPGGNESDIPKVISALLRPKHWHETTISGDLVVRRHWKEPVGIRKNGKTIFEQKKIEILRQNYYDGHKIDFVKNRLAFDFEWNSKDQTFDRDLYAFDAFAQAGAIDAAIIVTRDVSLNPIFAELGTVLTKAGKPAEKNGLPVPLPPKYGASTTWWGKLIYRLNAGRNGGCPVLAVGITPQCISDLAEWRANFHSAASNEEL